MEKIDPQEHNLNRVLYIWGWFRCTNCKQIRNGISHRRYKPTYMEICRYCIQHKSEPL